MIILGLYLGTGLIIGTLAKLLDEKDEVPWAPTLVISAALGVPMIIMALLDNDDV